MTESHKACPPTSHQVMEVLDAARRPLTPAELMERTGLKRRTLYFALECLNRRNAVKVGLSLRDARSRYYAIADELRDGAWRPCIQQGRCT